MSCHVKFDRDTVLILILLLLELQRYSPIKLEITSLMDVFLFDIYVVCFDAIINNLKKCLMVYSRFCVSFAQFVVLIALIVFPDSSMKAKTRVRFSVVTIY